MVQIGENFISTASVDLSMSGRSIYFVVDCALLPATFEVILTPSFNNKIYQFSNSRMEELH